MSKARKIKHPKGVMHLESGRPLAKFRKPKGTKLAIREGRHKGEIPDHYDDNQVSKEQWIPLNVALRMVGRFSLFDAVRRLSNRFGISKLDAEALFIYAIKKKKEKHW